MISAAGIFVILFSLIVGYTAHGGNLGILWQPYEMLIIFGTVIGSFMLANPTKVIKQTAREIPNVFRGAVFGKGFYISLLSLLHDILQKIQREGVMAIEDDIDEPSRSPIFRNYPNILQEAYVIRFITDYLRLIVLGNNSAFEIENLMEVEIETIHQEEEIPAHSVNRVADALPGFGIIAALLGIVMAMGEIDGPVNVIGSLVAAALIGTFIGIFTGYAFIGPLGQAMEHRARERSKVLQVVKTVVMAYLSGYRPMTAIEFGRKTLYESEKPAFDELESILKNRARKARQEKQG